MLKFLVKIVLSMCSVVVDGRRFLLLRGEYFNFSHLLILFISGREEKKKMERVFSFFLFRNKSLRVISDLFHFLSFTSKG